MTVDFAYFALVIRLDIHFALCGKLMYNVNYRIGGSLWPVDLTCLYVCNPTCVL